MKVRKSCAYGAIVAVLMGILVVDATAMSPRQKQQILPWTVSVAVAEDNVSSRVSGSSTGVPEDVYLTLSRMDSPDSSETVAVQKFEKTTSFTFSMPTVRVRTVFDVRVTTSTDIATTPILHWRTLELSENNPYLEYRGIPGFEAPPDFEDYWKRAKADLAKVPMTAVVTRVPNKDTKSGLLYRVDLPTVEETTVVAWMYVPRAAYDAAGKPVKKFPAVFAAPGYGAEQPPMDRTTSGLITMSLNPRNHGPSREYLKLPGDHLSYNITKPEKYYYRLAFMDCLRGFDYLLSRPEVDAARVATEGGSQGGLFAIAVAALDHRVAAVCSNVTAFSGYADREVLAIGGSQWKFNSIRKKMGDIEAAMTETSMAYTDGANMATMVKAPTQINMGGLDTICPWACGIVTMNRLPEGTEREYNLVLDARHEVPAPMREANWRWYQKHLKLAQ